MDAAVAGIVITAFVSVVASVLGFVNSRRADRSATTSRTIELGVKDLVDQYQEANIGLRAEVHDCKQECEELRKTVANQHSELEELKRRYDNMEAELIRLKRKAGEL